MNAENLQITQMQDSIVLRPAPMVRKPKSQVLGVVVNSAALTVYQVKTARGQTAFKFEARSKKYATKSDISKMISRMLGALSTKAKESAAQRQRRYYQKHKAEILAKKKAQRKQS